ncbi:MAG: SHOCT domain-containing protein [Halodesulfurarchaeum sp.]
MTTRNSTDSLLRILLVVLAAIILVPVLMMAFAVPMVWGGGMMGGYGATPVWSIGMSLVWLAILVGIGFMFYRWLSGGPGVAEDPALEELRLAYARGELSEEEFETRREKLGGD